MCEAANIDGETGTREAECDDGMTETRDERTQLPKMKGKLFLVVQ